MICLFFLGNSIFLFLILHRKEEQENLPNFMINILLIIFYLILPNILPLFI